VAVTPSIFLRGEYEYIQFFGLSGQSFALNTARIGAGYRF
jgi:opacity protein-like surface antigen